MAVPQAHLAERILVPAKTVSDEVVVALVDPRGEGVRLERAVTTNREIHPHLHLEDALVPDGDLLAGPAEGAAALSWMLEAAWTGLCALQLGVTESALRQTAEYLNQREQFGTTPQHLPGHPAPGGGRGHRRGGHPGDPLAGRLAHRHRARGRLAR